MTWAELLGRAVAVLREVGIEGAERDAQRLADHVLGGAGRFRLSAGDSPDTGQQARFGAAIAARAARQPVSQIIGRRAFWKHDFHVTRDTLDPRPDTETLIEAALALPWNSLLDMGTGTGAILISLLAERSGAEGLGTDISAAALEVARGNARRIGVEARFQQADWFDGVEGRFDLILSNPPYIALAEMAGLAPEVRDWEPHLALTDGADGLSAYRVIAAGAAAHLTPGGHVLVEIGAAQAEDVGRIFVDAGGEVRVLTDLDGRNRVVLVRFPAK
ncbi:peptide chain release factor N(5)-glutamine methyltransferase [Paracoccus sp. M683]|uniref:peptide chain release factor N(5)-glutamine methyltransferase n=1 Tax=Paracoccus sp. M683 TaxID=2594268 RepID=UPI00117FFF9E|nr:peptide chain release factor N(5)-glutamine methyltransferase [Paracoccus sp. M683]TRW98122.1 peptide chain release factor N(5)-glutamine methyltransferase [Paracoccus sp. M683]